MKLQQPSWTRRPTEHISRVTQEMIWAHDMWPQRGTLCKSVDEVSGPVELSSDHLFGF